MRLRELFGDDDAVSPVIGVILMVAITVILAAVIASFVLGLGSNTSVAPQASFATSYDESSSNVTIRHESGDPVVAEELYLRGNGFNDTTDQDGLSDVDNSWKTYYDNNMSSPESSTNAYYSGSISGQAEGEEAVVAGDVLTLRAYSDYEMSIVWEASEGDSSSTLAEAEGPQA